MRIASAQFFAKVIICTGGQALSVKNEPPHPADQVLECVPA
jgi:hypothetical protein